MDAASNGESVGLPPWAALPGVTFTRYGCPPDCRHCVELEVKLPCVDRSAYSARRCMDALAPFLHPERSDELRLLVSELVTNSILHAGGDERSWIHLIVKIIPARRVRAEVRDYGPGFRPAVPESVDDDQLIHGRGLFLVEHLADSWGVETEGTTKVWFEIDLGR